MSVQTALDNINLKPTARWGHTEYSIEYHQDYLNGRIEPNPSDHEFWSTALDSLDLDFRWSTNHGLIDWSQTGRITDMGHASYALDGSDQREPVESPFKSTEEIWSFDAVAEYGLPDFDEQVQAYEQVYQTAQKTYPNQLTTGGYYRTIISGAIDTFGWEMLLLGASEPAKMEKVFDSFFRRTLFYMKAWAQTSAPVLIQHDDFVWTAGAFMNPVIYREVIIPRYAELWKVLHDSGKKVLFCSDGDFTEFAEEIINAGADGLIFEPCMDFGIMVDQFGQSSCLVGSYVDCRDLTYGKWEKVKSDIDRTLEKLQDSSGAIIAVGNHMPPNIPPQMMDQYFEYLLPKLEK
jgi:hypothetical protein